MVTKWTILMAMTVIASAKQDISKAVALYLTHRATAFY